VSDTYDTAQPYIAAYVILRRDDKVAFVLREHTKWMNGHYTLPSGKVEQDESFLACAVREAREETGITIQPEDLKHVLTSHRNDPDSTNAPMWIDIYFEASEWEGDPYNAEPAVHGELAWLDLDNLPDNIVPNVRFCLDQIKAGQTYAEYGWE
jgi:8-oxo-dGTP pyrophosphatase MutT (NUDIX family)